MDRSLSKPWKTVKAREAWCAAVHGVAKGRTRLSDCTTTMHVTSPSFVQTGGSWGEQEVGPGEFHTEHDSRGEIAKNVF